MCAQHPARERANDATREDASAKVQVQITADSVQERQREAETSEVATDRWILTGIASSVGGKCHHTVATSTVCIILILVDHCGPEWTRVDQSGPEWTRVDQSGPATVMVEIVDEGDQMGTRGTAGPSGPLWTIVDQSGPATVMAEIVDEGDQMGTRGTAGS